MSSNYSGVILPSGSDYYMYLSNGDLAVSTVINENGVQYVSRGGTASTTVINDLGGQLVYSSGVARNTTINSGGVMSVFSGGTATGIIQSEGGQLGVAVSGNDTAVVSGSNAGGSFYYRNGVAGGFILYNDGAQNVYAGGSALRTIVSRGGCQQLLSGGSAQGTVLDSGGSLLVQSGGTATGVDQQTGGNVFAFVTGSDSRTRIAGSHAEGTFSYSNGVASNFVIYAGGYQQVSRGGVTRDLTLSGGILYVLAGGSAIDVDQKTGGTFDFTAQGGDLTTRITGSNAAGSFSYINGVVSGFQLYAGGNIRIGAGGAARSNTVSAGGILYVLDGGSADMNTVAAGGILSVFSGGRATGIDQAGGNVNLNVIRGDSGTLVSGSNANGTFFYSNGNASGFELNSGGLIGVYSGGTAHATRINSGGTLLAATMGNAENTIISSGGTLAVEYGGSARNVSQLAGGELLMSIYAGDSLTVLSGTHVSGGFSVKNGVGSNLLLEGGAEVEVLAGASAVSTTISRGGLLQVNGSARATGVRVVSSGGIRIENGGSATGIVQQEGGRILVEVRGNDKATLVRGSHMSGSFSYSSGIASNFLLYDCMQSVSSGGQARETTVSAGGEVRVMSGGLAQSAKVHSAGAVYVDSGGSASYTSVFSGGKEYVEAGSSFAGTVYNGGSQIVGFRGVIASARINSGGVQIVSAGGSVTGTVVSRSGAVEALSGGTVNNLNAADGGVFTVQAGAILSGTISVGGSMTVGGTVYTDQAEINMVLTRRTAADGVIIDTLRNFSSKTTYSVTVIPKAYGSYKLASGAQNFTRSVTIKNSDGSKIGTLVPKQSITVGETIYTLTESSGTLSLTLEHNQIGPGPDPEYSKTFNCEISSTSTSFTIGDEPLPGAFYSISGDFGQLNAYIDVIDSQGALVAGGAVNGGKLTFRPVLLNTGSYSITIRSTDGGVSGTPFSLTLKSENFTRITDDWANVKTEGDAGLPAEYSLGAITASGELLTEYVGYSDSIDYRKFTLDSAAKLSFSIFADGKTELTIYQLTGQNGKYSLKKIKSVSGKADQTAVLKELLLEKGDYYFSVKSPDASKGGNALYTVSVQQESVFFTKGNNTDDWTNVKTSGAAGLSSAYTVKAKTGNVATDWVGFGDAIDYRKLELDSAAKLSLTINSGDAARLTVYELVANKNGTYTLKKLKNISVKAGQSAVLKDVLLDSTAKNYYFSVESTNAKKGGNADYTVTIDNNSVFYTKGNNADDWTNFKTAGAAGLSSTYTVKAQIGNVAADWVGFGDAIDYRKLELDSAAKLSFTITSGDAARLTVYELVANKNGTYTLKKLKNLSVKAGQSAVLKDVLLDSTAKNYYFSVESTNAKKGGNADYSVTIDSNSLFYTKGNNADDWTNFKTAGAAGLDSAYTVKVKPGTILSDWVGFGDEIDYRKLDLDSSAKLSLTVTSGDNVVLTVHELVANQNGSYTLKKVKSVSVKAGQSAVLENLLLDDSKDYYLSVKSSNAKKGGSADYSVSVNSTSVFYTSGNNADDWTNVKTAGAAGLPEIFNLGSAAEGTGFSEWVGFGDAVDYRKFEVDAAAFYDLDFQANGKSKLAVYELTEKSGTYALKQLKSVTHSGDNLSRMIENLRLETGTYYLGITSTDAMKGGNTDYSVEFSRITLA